MDPKLKYELIKEAQLRLVQNPQDDAHDITHHYRVLMNVNKLIKAENFKDINWNVLELITWWHDVEIIDYLPNENIRIAEKTARYVSNKFKDSILKDKIFDSIKNHELGNSPKYLEGKILHDADKLEIISGERLRVVDNAVKAGVFPKDKGIKVLRNILDDMLNTMYSSYFFDYSKRFHEENVEDFRDKINGLIQLYSESEKQ